MLKKRDRTEKSKYKHQSTGDYCTCAAYVAEIMCIRNAENKNEGSLPYKFWNKKPWNWTFKRQLLVANTLLKQYPEEVLVRSINAPEFKKIFSLNNAKVKSILNKYNVEYEQSKKKEVKEIDIKENPTTRQKTYGKRSIFDKIRSIKSGKEEDE
jgi:hypothetical protein